MRTVPLRGRSGWAAASPPDQPGQVVSTRLYDHGMRVVGSVAEAIDRLRGANLIPPIGGVEQVGPIDEDHVLVTVRTPIDVELRARVAEVLEGISYELREAAPTHGIGYRRP
jgi:hypothetical protein